VTPTGELVVANAQSHPDLFWALRGGGGSTFGVVVEATVKALPTPKILLAAYALNGTSNEDGYWKSVAQLHRELPALSEAGLQGYYYVYPKITVGMFIAQGKEADQANIEKVLEPALSRMAAFDGVGRPETVYTAFETYSKFFDGEWGPLGNDDDSGMNMKHHRRHRLLPRDMPGMESGSGDAAEPNGRSQLDSRLLGARHLNHPNLEQLLRAAMPKTTHGELRGNFVAGPGVANPPDGANATSVTPAWRNALTNLVASGAEGSWNADSLRELAPDSGAYLNEGSWNQPAWKEAFWGSQNYEKLLTIKKRYDPENVLWCTPCVGADLMEIKDNGRLCKLTSAPASSPTLDAQTVSVPPTSDNPVVNNDMEGNEGRSIKKWQPKGYKG
jgi:hypothetical protein